jgi:hypothetical protein
MSEHVNDGADNNPDAAIAQPASTTTSVKLSRFAQVVASMKDLKEFITIVVFFAAGAAWTVNYFATHAELEKTRTELADYRCINDTTLKMLVNSQTEEFLSQQVVTARRELRRTEDALDREPKDSSNRRTLADAVDDQRASLDSLIKNRDNAAKTKDQAFRDLQATNQGIRKPCGPHAT